MLNEIKLDDVKFRLFELNDSVIEINALLREAYSPLAKAGMRYAAATEDSEATQRNIQNGECHLGILNHKIVACVVLRIPKPDSIKLTNKINPNWYNSEGIVNFGRFAVKPELQAGGLGSQMMKRLEARAKELGFKELALDTAETATHLIKYYETRGYRFIEYHQWETTNYRSVIMSKKLI